mmetsp:Transcript_17667/g.36687  ORF Transcript_17667/g.36687 Transcript_17667/m.36687 type:complete len:118 (-) Transcript_17667:522-875(-)
MRRVVDVLKTCIILDDDKTLVSVARFIMSKWRVVRLNNTFRNPSFTGTRELTYYLTAIVVRDPKCFTLEWRSRQRGALYFASQTLTAHPSCSSLRSLPNLSLLAAARQSFLDVPTNS